MDGTWRLWGMLFVLAALAVGALLGFIVMPVVQGRAAGIDAYTAICRAIGILPGSPARPTPPSQAAPQPVTQVSWTAATFDELYRADRASGARIAEERCIACHTVEGNTPDPTIPRNVGQSILRSTSNCTISAAARATTRRCCRWSRISTTKRSSIS